VLQQAGSVHVGGGGGGGGGGEDPLPAAAHAGAAAVALLDQESVIASSLATTTADLEAEEAAADLAFGLANAWRSSLPVQLMSVGDDASMGAVAFHRYESIPHTNSEICIFYSISCIPISIPN
jgi:hypothetical protein